MKFCLLSMDPEHKDDDGKVSAAHPYSVNIWAEIMGGQVHYGPDLNQLNYDAVYDFFSGFDLIMIVLRAETIDAGIKIKQRSTAKVVILLEGELDHFTTHTPRFLQARMVELLNIVDAVAVLHDESIPLFKSLTFRPIGLVGQPFPLEKVRKLCPPVHKNEEIELGSCIRSTFMNNRNSLINLAALSQTGIPGVIDMLDPVEEEYLQSVREYAPLPQIRLRQNNRGWEHYITQAGYSFLGLHLDYGYTWGTFPIECAAVRMPCVAPPSFYSQKILFPRLCVPHYDVMGAASLVKKLVSDPGFYEETVSFALSQIEFFSHDQCKRRLLNLIS